MQIYMLDSGLCELVLSMFLVKFLSLGNLNLSLGGANHLGAYKQHQIVKDERLSVAPDSECPCSLF